MVRCVGGALRRQRAQRLQVRPFGQGWLHWPDADQVGIEPNPVTDQEQHVFTYALLPHQEGWQAGGTVRQAYFLNQPALAVAGGAADTGVSLASVDAPNVVLETVKRAEDGDGVILRLYECENAKTPVTLTWNGAIASAEADNCIEEKTGEVEVAGNQVRFTIKPYEVKTIRIR